MKKSLEESSNGVLIARALAGSWRKECPATIDISELQLDRITPLLCDSGAAALGWWRIRETILKNTPSAGVLHQVYRLQALQSALHQEKIVKVFSLLREAAADAILAKGWAAANLYPDAALRPYGDIDVCVRREHFRAAEEVLRSPAASDCWVDLHRAFSELEDRSFDELYARSHLMSLGEEKIRILSPEDHLALLAIHLLKHGAWRPLWLCDIAAAIESLPVVFNWDICLGDSRTRANWITCAIGLTHLLLGAKIDCMPSPRAADELPSWLVNSVLKQWSNLLPADHRPIRPLPLMANYFRKPGGVLKAIRGRWPDPVTATFNLKGLFNNSPRLPYQVGDFLRGAGDFLFHLPAKLTGKA